MGATRLRKFLLLFLANLHLLSAAQTRTLHQPRTVSGLPHMSHFPRSAGQLCPLHILCSAAARRQAFGAPDAFSGCRKIERSREVSGKEVKEERRSGRHWYSQPPEVSIGMFLQNGEQHLGKTPGFGVNYRHYETSDTVGENRGAPARCWPSTRGQSME